MSVWETKLARCGQGVFAGLELGEPHPATATLLFLFTTTIQKKKELVRFLSRVCVTLHLFLFHFLFCFLMFRIDDAAEMGADRQLYPQTSSNNKSKTIEAWIMERLIVKKQTKYTRDLFIKIMCTRNTLPLNWLSYRMHVKACCSCTHL